MDTKLQIGYFLSWKRNTLPNCLSLYKFCCIDERILISLFALLYFWSLSIYVYLSIYMYFCLSFIFFLANEHFTKLFSWCKFCCTDERIWSHSLPYFISDISLSLSLSLSLIFLLWKQTLNQAICSGISSVVLMNFNLTLFALLLSLSLSVSLSLTVSVCLFHRQNKQDPGQCFVDWLSNQLASVN